LLLRVLAFPRRLAAELLARGGADATFIRGKSAKRIKTSSLLDVSTGTHHHPPISCDDIEIHGVRWKAEDIRMMAPLVRAYKYDWEKMRSRPRDIVICHANGAISFDLTLAEDKTSFTLWKQGWEKNHLHLPLRALGP